MPWSKALPHCSLGQTLVFSASVHTQAFWRDLPLLLGPWVSVGAGIQSHNGTGAVPLYRTCFLSFQIPNLQKQMVNHSNVDSESFKISFLLIGSGMLVPSSLPALLWHLIAKHFGHSGSSKVLKTLSAWHCARTRRY